MPNSIVMDFETTGVNILQDRPVQVATGVWTPEGKQVHLQSHILDPQMESSSGAFKIHKIGIKEIALHGKSLQWFAKYWNNLIWQYQPARLLGYNLINFDLPILQRLLQQFGSGKFRQPPLEGIVDVMFLAQRFFHSRKWPKLIESVNRLGITHNEKDFHDAKADVLYTWKVYQALIKRSK